MAEESISLSGSELTFLRALHEQGVEFMIVGLSAALLQGVPAVTQDIDLWVKDLGGPQFLAAVKSCKACYVPPGIAGMNPPMLASADLRGIDLVASCHGLGTIEQELRSAVEVFLGGIPTKVLPLERIIISKEAAGREKDRAALPMLRAALAAMKSS